METTLRSTMDGRAVLEGFFQAEMTGDEEAIHRFVHPDVVMYWPQSGERFTGRDRALAAMAAVEVQPEPAGEPRIIGGGNVWVLTMPVKYGADLNHYVGIYEIEGGQIRRSTEFFAAPFPAGESRRQFADPPTDAAGAGEGA